MCGLHLCGCAKVGCTTGLLLAGSCTVGLHESPVECPVDLIPNLYTVPLVYRATELLKLKENSLSNLSLDMMTVSSLDTSLAKEA